MQQSIADGNRPVVCYWSSKSINEPYYCRYHKAYTPRCEGCKVFISKQLADTAMRLVVDKRARKKADGVRVDKSVD